MGNCLNHESSMQWGGDDWGSPAKDGHFGRDSYPDMADKSMEMEEKGLLGEGSSCSSSATTKTKTKTTTTEVKIKITRKQLEQLLGSADIKELSVQQVLAQLMKVSDRYEAHQRSWRPALQSIPEVN